MRNAGTPGGVNEVFTYTLTRFPAGTFLFDFLQNCSSISLVIMSLQVSSHFLNSSSITSLCNVANPKYYFQIPNSWRYLGWLWCVGLLLVGVLHILWQMDAMFQQTIISQLEQLQKAVVTLTDTLKNLSQTSSTPSNISRNSFETNSTHHHAPIPSSQSFGNHDDLFSTPPRNPSIPLNRFREEVMFDCFVPISFVRFSPGIFEEDPKSNGTRIHDAIC